MQIRRLILDNFGVFRGRTEIDLTPRRRYRAVRPVVLIGGTNGSGKTTILESLRLCLYGPLALGERVSQEQYHNYLRDSIHRHESTLLPMQSAAVGIEFEYGLGGRLHVFNVTRSWDCNSAGVTTSLTVTCDKTPLDQLESAHAEEFLRDLIPRGVSQLFFFDGEKIQEMAQAADDDLALADAVRGLLGLDIIGRLHSDLAIYSARLQGAKAPKALRKELDEIAKKLNCLKDERLKVSGALDRSQSRLDRVTQDVARAKQKLVRVGGVFANDRAGLEAEKSRLEQSIEDLEHKFREMCGDLVPFAFASRLCADLIRQLDAERLVQQWQSLQELVQSRVGETKQCLDDAIFPTTERALIEGNLRELVLARVRNILDRVSGQPENLPDVSLVHRLSNDDHLRLLGALHRILDDIPKQLSILEVELESQMRRLADISASVKKIPDNDVLEPVVERLNNLNQMLGESKAEVKRCELELRSLDHQIEVQQRHKKRKEDDLANAQAGTEQRHMATSVQAVLDDYSKELTKAKVGELAAAVEGCFAQLWRKGDVLHGIKIDPETCSVILLDKHHRVLPKERLSAGEKQIYAISMLWALARVSGRVLPMVIDTPLARLDSKHRHHLVTRYFPHVSHQVVILSTDTEIDQAYFQELGPSISHAYHLQFNDIDGQTVLEEGYFWGRRELEAMT